MLYNLLIFNELSEILTKYCYNDDYGYDWRMLKRSQRILKSNKPKEEKIKKLREILDYFTGKYANKKRNL